MTAVEVSMKSDRADVPPPPVTPSVKDTRQEVPALGYINYWYPALPASRLKRKPVGIRLLGQDIVLFRSDGQVHALEDRCPHKGMPLSIGKTLFPGTITCAYHGWTFDGCGECVAAVNEGPQSRAPGKARIRSYAVQERVGTIWVFIGDIEPPPLERDMPSKLLEPGRLTFALVLQWRANWRLAMENVADPSHDNLVHRSSVRNFFKRVRVYKQMEAVPAEDGGGFYLNPGFEPEVPGTKFGGVGQFPSRTWWRRLNGSVRPTLGGRFMSEIRLPGYLQVNTYPWMMIEWSVPVDVDSSRQYVWVLWQREPSTKILGWLYWWLSYSRVMRQFLSQDAWIVEAQERVKALARPEKLSRNDVGVIHWRKLAARARG